MLFNTAKKLAKIPKNLEVEYREKLISVTTSYKYLGIQIGPTMIQIDS